MDFSDSITLPYTQTHKPFGKIKLCFLPDGRKQVAAYLLMEHIRPVAQTGIAIEGSHAMRPAFGAAGQHNLVAMAAQKMGSYLARKVDDDGNTTLIYWSTGADGCQVEEIGDLTAYQVEQYPFAGPKHFGERVCLLPAVRYFTERFASAPWGMYVFFTQGVIDDLDEVKRYTTELAEQIAAGKRPELKLVLVGVDHKIDQTHLQQLDNLHTGTPVDLWDYRIASQMKDVIEIFTELGDANTIVAPAGRILDPSGQVLTDYTKGLPALLNFVVPKGVHAFTLELGDQKVTQVIA
jgi:hypothetical protein